MDAESRLLYEIGRRMHECRDECPAPAAVAAIWLRPVEGAQMSGS